MLILSKKRENAHLECTRDKSREVLVRLESDGVGKWGGVVVGRVGGPGDVAVDSLIEVVHRRAANKDLQTVTVVVDSDRSAMPDERGPQLNALLRAPVTSRRLRIEYDRVAGTAKAYVEGDIALVVEEVECGVLAGAGLGQVSRRGAEDEDAVEFEREGKVDGFADTEEMERSGLCGHGESNFLDCVGE